MTKENAKFKIHTAYHAKKKESVVEKMRRRLKITSQGAPGKFRREPRNTQCALSKEKS